MKPPPAIGDLQLAASVALVLIAGVISAALQLGLLRNLLWATARTVVQLMLVGYVLTEIFAIDHPLLVAGIVALMCLVAGRAVIQRVERPPFGAHLLAALALGASTYLVGSVVCALIIGADPWYTAPIAIPIAGMLLGNSLTGNALALDRFFGEVRARADEVELRLSLGYSPWEAVRPQLRTALRSGMTPMINAMMVAGIVALPGMMTGQILAGAPPLAAVRYQIVVMTMLAAAVALSCLLVVGLAYRRCFTDDEALRPELQG
jgi:putative ABC transport system permease protein